ncbi:hypothetical protein [Mycolicibacterium fortuitum]|nr:hypothetical protein [Mycolicibacterium fortuitum]
MTRAQMLRKILEQELSDDIEPLLRERGFIRKGRVFRRQRGLLYDGIGIHDVRRGKFDDFHTFSVSVGIGSTEIDRFPPEPVVGQPNSTISRPWGRLVPGLPEYFYFDETYDVDIWGCVLSDGLERVVDVMDQFDSSRTLARWAAANNLLYQYERTCGYLAAVGDVDTLVSYVRKLQSRFGHESRWEFFSRDIVAAVGSSAALLEAQGVLAPFDSPSVEA